MPAALPENTTSCGPLMAASDTSAATAGASAASRSWACRGVARAASMAPPAGSACMSAPRRTIRRAASSSVIAPATTIAANSPMEWPTRTAGTTPQACHMAASA